MFNYPTYMKLTGRKLVKKIKKILKVVSIPFYRKEYLNRLMCKSIRILLGGEYIYIYTHTLGTIARVCKLNHATPNKLSRAKIFLCGRVNRVTLQLVKGSWTHGQQTKVIVMCAIRAIGSININSNIIGERRNERVIYIHSYE